MSVTCFNPHKVVLCNKLIFQEDSYGKNFADYIDGKLYAMSGHSHKGEIAMFCGTNMHNLKKLYDIKTNFDLREQIEEIREKIYG